MTAVIDSAREPGVPPARRSCLSVPGSSERKLARTAAGLGADEIVIDLEDAVAASAKQDNARPRSLEGGEVVSAAPELARLSLNVAMAHHDRGAASAGRRLVCASHTIGIAAAQATRALPSLVMIAGWHGCDHLAPVYEDDTPHSQIELERREPLPYGGGLAHLRSRVRALREGGAQDDVLGGRFVGVMA